MQKKRTRKEPGLVFNHAMIYTRDLEKSLEFYKGLLGLELVEDYRYRDRRVYARLKSGGDGTIALHLAGPGEDIRFGTSVRLYFEVRNLERKCKEIESAGGKLKHPPKLMPWGWKHTYLDDPDGHEVSLYWAGAKRFRKSTMR